MRIYILECARKTVKYVCLECKRTFLHCAKLTDNDPSFGMNTPSITKSFETYVCPYCRSLSIDEFVEPHPVIASVKSVELDKVDEWIGQGYQVKELYAKMATMVKKEASKE